MAFITLLTDFGVRDGYAGVLKGVIWKIAPEAQIADITHAISPQNILEGAMALDKTVPFFPAGTIHVAVVDPGVGTKRESVAARLGDAIVVGPDNGLFSLLLERAENLGQPVEVVKLDKPAFWLPDVSHVFHGRDIFAPVAAHLANGVSLKEIGSPHSGLARLEIPKPEQTDCGIRGQIMVVDHFGNLISNIPIDTLAGKGEPIVQCHGRELRGIKRTFGEVAAGDLAVISGTMGELEIVVNQGSAAEILGAKVGDPVEVRFL
ncbi:MAG TPA: SAM-dependent chlorinase/fluorinase [Anaerolineaceae bacterium]|nr:SAM-dependent chlorinase/fluorinase [Anaerolineaceae bacterium]HPN52717.1 SAM-dependent chlorinase/fluorinase [Anaerolineaceae bacterium]